MTRRMSLSKRQSLKRKQRDWDQHDIDDETWRYRDTRIPPSTELLFSRYEKEWHPKPGERFLTRREFTNLSLDLNTTKITIIHDEGMRRLREAARRRESTTRSADLYRPLAALSYTDSYRPSATLSTDSYRPSESRSMSSLDCYVSSRSSTPQPRVKHSSAAVYDPDQPPAPPLGTPSKGSLPHCPEATPQPTMRTATTKAQPVLTKTEYPPQISDLPAMAFAPTLISATPLQQPPRPGAVPSPSKTIEQSPFLSSSPRKPLFAAPESPQKLSPTPSETPPPPPPPLPQQPPYTPPKPAELADANSIIRAACADDETKALARHTQQVKAGKLLVWIDAVKLAVEVPCLGVLVADADGGAQGMTEVAMMSALAGLLRWEEAAEKARGSLVEAVGGLQGMGIGTGAVGEMGERLGEVMKRVGRARWALVDCLMVMRRVVVVAGGRVGLGGEREE